MSMVITPKNDTCGNQEDWDQKRIKKKFLKSIQHTLKTYDIMCWDISTPLEKDYTKYSQCYCGPGQTMYVKLHLEKTKEGDAL